MNAILHAIEAQIRDIRRAIAQRPYDDELVPRLEDRERVRASIAAEVRGMASLPRRKQVVTTTPTLSYQSERAN